MSMTAPQAFIPRNRLASALKDTGGETAAELIAAADRLVAGKCEAIKAYVGETVARIVALETVRDEELRAQGETIGRDALGIADVAGAAGLETLGEVARGLAVAVQALRESGVWRADVLRLHISGLRAVATGQAGPPEAVGALLLQLRALRAAFGATE
jgi:hypothetical protein